jgi:phospholipase C
MGYYNGQDIPYYWNLADNYVLFDRMFSSALDGSFDNHVYWVAGARLGKTTFTSQAASDMTTIFDRLEEKGISWKFYVENYDSTVNYRTQSAIEIENPNRISQIIWVPLLNMDHYLDDPKLFSRIVDLSEYYTDVQNGTLPAVSYIVPSGASEHPPGRIQSGERFTRGLVQELMRSSSWSTSAFLISYDDWGGWYDHVPPPQVDDFGYGFRVPTLLVSPYAKQGFIDHTEYDFTSIMKFIEENWGLAPLAERDANARNILNAFDFNQPPRPPNFVSSARGVAPPASPSLPIIYVAYGAILFLAGVFLVRAVITRQRPQPIRARQRRVP